MRYANIRVERLFTNQGGAAESKEGSLEGGSCHSCCSNNNTVGWSEYQPPLALPTASKHFHPFNLWPNPPLHHSTTTPTTSPLLQTSSVWSHPVTLQLYLSAPTTHCGIYPPTLPLPAPKMTDYTSLKVPDLKKLLQERSLQQSGNKADLIARLQDHDKSTTIPNNLPCAGNSSLALLLVSLTPILAFLPAQHAS
jgi:hypothetical protein